MIEKIGKITLDYKYYPGEDFYCDGVIEDELLEIVKNNPVSEYSRIIEERASWPILYHLSPLRGNIVDWVPVDASIRQKRREAIFNCDRTRELRKSHENPYIIQLYDEFLGKPMSEKAHKLLHTVYFDRKNGKK